MKALERRQVMLEPETWAKIDNLVDPDDINQKVTQGHSKVIRKILRWGLANLDKIQPINKFGNVTKKK